MFVFYATEKDCRQPPPKPHMKFDTSEGTLFGALVKVSCEKGQV